LLRLLLPLVLVVAFADFYYPLRGHARVRGSALPFTALSSKFFTLRALSHAQLALPSVSFGVLMADLSPISFEFILRLFGRHVPKC
jgi:hypothetical protein